MTEKAGIKPLTWDMSFGDRTFILNAALLWDENDTILVDTGIPGQLAVIRESFAQASSTFEQLSKIIITHQDLDHIGSLPEIITALDDQVEVLASERTKPYILGEEAILKRGIKVPPSKVDRTIQDGEILPYCGGIQVIFTPGHTPDHISLYHLASKTLISGDALTARDGVVMPPDPNFTPDMETALRSVARLAEWDIETVIAYHGGVCQGGIKERLLEIANGNVNAIK